MTTIVVPFYGYLNNRIKKLWNITKLAKRRSLDISNQDEVGANVIALDIVKRKLLYAKKTPDTSSCLIIDLKDLDRCSITRQYSSIDAGELTKRTLGEFLKSIFLNLHFKSCSRVVSLPLYEAEKGFQGDIEVLEAKAERWKKTVSLLLPLKIKERA